MDLTIPAHIRETTVSEKWKWRFAFFEMHGGPASPTFKSAMKALRLRGRARININFWAVFWGPIYFLVLGLWQRNLVLLAMAMAIGMLLPGFLARAIGTALALVYGMTANYAYYLKKVKGEVVWNPFHGLRWF